MRMRLDTIIEGGTVVTPKGTLRADVGVRGEVIAAIGPGLARANPGAAVVDARDHLVLPGIIDVHVHLALPVKGTVTSDDFRTGTRAAARGGVTTVLDFATAYGDETLGQAIDTRFRQAEGRAVVDYAFHVCVTNWARQKDEIHPLIHRGFPTFKEFTVYASEGWQSDDAVVFNTLEMMRDEGGLLLLHAESSGVLDELVRRHHTRALMRKYGARLHAITRPAFIEGEAVARAATWCAATGGPLYIVHLSTAIGAEIVRQARADGASLHAETCPQYLVLDESVFARKDGHLFATSPQVKTRADQRRLWEALAAGDLTVVATDTCTFTRRQKAAWRGDFTKIPGGMPGLETLLPIVYTHGVLKKRLTLGQLCERLAEGPAKIMGLWPRKGAIQVGADADLVIVHPTKRIAVDPAAMETNCDWSPYEGWRLAGFARTTLSRGEVIVDGYKVVGREGRGQWLARRLG